jgi:aspartate/tyrosine/aromatic aminotransferase
VSLPSLARIAAPPDSILGLAEAFRNDPRAGKINLSSGVFVDETGTTPVLPTVIEAERRLAGAAGSKLYRPIDG